MSQNHGSWLSTATALFFAWALLTLPVRIWVKLGRKSSWGFDDTAIVCALVAAVVHVAAIFWAIDHGYGLLLAEIQERDKGVVERALFVAQIFYLIAIGLSKISTALFIGQLTRYAPQIRLSYILAAVSGVFIIASTIIIALRNPLAHPWTTFDGSEALYIRWIAVEAVGLAIEVALWLLSIYLTWGLHMKLQKRIMILGAFGCRLILIPIVAIRLFYLSPSQNSDPTRTSILAAILTEASLEYSILSASITTIRPFLRPFHSGAIVNTVGGADFGSRSRTRSTTQDLYMLSQVSNSDKNRTVEKVKATRDPSLGSQNRDNGVGPAQNLRPLRRPNQFEQHTVVPARGGDDMGSVESVSSAQMIIRTTKDWSVRYEDE